MLGLELVDPETGEPNTEAALSVQRVAIERGLILELGGRGNCVVRLLPPLNVTRETLEQAFDILDFALAQASAAGDGAPACANLEQRLMAACCRTRCWVGS